MNENVNDNVNGSDDKFGEYAGIINYLSGFIKEVGMEMLELREGYCRGRIILTEKHNNPMGTVHGGVIFSLADTVGGTAELTYGSKIVTLNSNINYLSPGKNTEYIEAEAYVVKNGRTTAVVDVMVRNAEGKDIAKVTNTYYKTT